MIFFFKWKPSYSIENDVKFTYYLIFPYYSHTRSHTEKKYITSFAKWYT